MPLIENRKRVLKISIVKWHTFQVSKLISWRRHSRLPFLKVILLVCEPNQRDLILEMLSCDSILMDIFLPVKNSEALSTWLEHGMCIGRATYNQSQNSRRVDHNLHKIHCQECLCKQQDKLQSMQ